MPERLLAQFAESGVNSSPKLICQMELLEFDEQQHQILMPLLWQYALHNRDSNEFSTIVAVGSAIRQYVAELDVSRVGDVTKLLDPGDTAGIPVEIELEVAKMVFQKFDANPPINRNPQPRLSNRLIQMIIAYLNPIDLPRERCAAATMLAIQAIAVMGGPLSHTIIEPLNEVPFEWFRKQLHRRLSQTADS
jgi:hypothetical protein